MAFNIKKKQKNLRRKAQSFMEYSLLIACFVAAILGLQIYLKRTMQGKFREAADGIGGQYAPQQATSEINTVVNPVIIDSQPTPVWLKFPNGTVNASGTDISGEYIVDNYGLPVFGIETKTTYSETVTKTGTEEMDRFEDDLFK